MLLGVPMKRRSSRHLVRQLALAAPLRGRGTAAATWRAPGAAASPPIASAPEILRVAGVVSLPASLHPMARPEFEIGRLDPEMRLEGVSLLFRPSPLQSA